VREDEQERGYFDGWGELNLSCVFFLVLFWPRLLDASRRFRLVAAWCGEAPFLYLSYFFGAQSARWGVPMPLFFVSSECSKCARRGWMYALPLRHPFCLTWCRLGAREGDMPSTGGWMLLLSLEHGRDGGCATRWMYAPSPHLSFLFSCGARSTALYCTGDVRRLDIYTFVVPTLCGLFLERRGGSNPRGASPRLVFGTCGWIYAFFYCRRCVLTGPHCPLLRSSAFIDSLSARDFDTGWRRRRPDLADIRSSRERGVSLRLLAFRRHSLMPRHRLREDLEFQPCV
jgi:hypothetical protein